VGGSYGLVGVCGGSLRGWDDSVGGMWLLILGDVVASFRYFGSIWGCDGSVRVTQLQMWRM
jgi:hypothetical protein